MIGEFECHSVNLLPWREQNRQQNKKRFLQISFLGLVVTYLLFWVCNVYLDTLKQVQIGHNQQLQKEAESLEQQLSVMHGIEQQQAEIAERIAAMESLQKERNRNTDFMNLLSDLVPQGVVLEKVTMKNQQIEIIGMSDNNQDLSDLLTNVERSPWVTEIKMHSIVEGNRFRLSFELVQNVQLSPLVKG
ncbi:MAG: PilN domain-containing protein [Vibrio sp.]